MEVSNTVLPDHAFVFVQCGGPDGLTSADFLQDAPPASEQYQFPNPNVLDQLDYQGSIMAFCGNKDLAVRLLRSAIQHNYCALSALDFDPLLAKLRGTPEFADLRVAANECQRRFLAAR